MANDIPSRPQTLADLMAGLMQDQDDSGDLPDTQLYDAQALMETVAVSDAVSLLTHGAAYRYDVFQDYDAMLALEPGLIHWWKCHEAAFNLADSGSLSTTGSILYRSGATSYSITGPFVHFPAETAVSPGTGDFRTSTFALLPSVWTIETWIQAPAPGGKQQTILFGWAVATVTFYLTDVGAPVGQMLVEVQLFLYLNGNLQTRTIIPATTVPVGAWHHLVLTFDGNAFTLWADDASYASQAFPGQTVTFDSGTMSGVLVVGPTGFDFCELAVYDHVLSPATIANHYQTGFTPSTDSRYGLAVYA